MELKEIVNRIVSSESITMYTLTGGLRLTWFPAGTQPRTTQDESWLYGRMETARKTGPESEAGPGALELDTLLDILAQLDFIAIPQDGQEYKRARRGAWKTATIEVARSGGAFQTSIIPIANGVDR